MKYLHILAACAATFAVSHSHAQAPADVLPAPSDIPAAPADPITGERFSDIPIDIAAEKLDASGELATASGNVQISYGATTIYCDEAVYDPNTRDVVVVGNVRIYRDGQLVTAERAVYNLETKDITAAAVRGDSQPFLFSGSSFQNIGKGPGYLVKDGFFTTSDAANPDWSFRARRVRIYPGDRIVFTDVKLYVGNTPIMWLPYVYQSLNKENALVITPGYSSLLGAYVLTNYTFPISETMGGSLRLDYLSSKGPAIGFDSEWLSGEKDENWGEFISYMINDSSPDTNETALARESVDSSRYRVTLRARQYLAEDIYANVDINLLSDARVLQDFYEGEFRDNPNPRNLLSLTKLGDDYSVTLQMQKQFNDFFDSTERLPELALDITRQPLFNTGLFYEGDTSIGRYNRHFAEGSAFNDYDSTRFDTFHQILYPKTFFGWLSVVPRVGARGTWYSNSGRVFAFEALSTRTLADGTEQEIRSIENRLISGSSLFRPVFNAGLEMSFKASKTFEHVQSRKWGLDGLRHVAQPYMNFSFVTAGEDARDILQFDRIQASSQLPPIDFPAFNSIDSIADWNILRLGIHNRLQTRRDNATFNWLELNSFFDVRFDRPDFGILTPDGGTFSNFVNRLRWTPLTWVNVQLDGQFPLFDEGFNEFNARINFLANDRTQITIGHRYIEGNTLFQDSSQLNFGGYFRIDDNWAFSFNETYEFTESLLQTQRYELHRDLSSWVASLGVIARNNKNGEEEVIDYGVILTFTLKDLPDLKVPVSFDPSGSGQ